MEDIASPQIETKIKELQGAVSQYSKYDNHKKSSITGFSLNLNSAYMYGIIPAVIFLLLLISRPSFVKEEIHKSDGSLVLQTSFKKIIMWTLLIGGILDIGLYGATYKLKKA